MVQHTSTTFFTNMEVRAGRRRRKLGIYGDKTRIEAKQLFLRVQNIDIQRRFFEYSDC